MKRTFVKLLTAAGILLLASRLNAGNPTVPGADTNRVYNVGQIPNATVWHGQTLEFMATSDLGGSAVLSASVLGSPRGNLTFEPATGRLRYTPDAADKRPFTVRIVASLNGQTRTQDVEISPAPLLPPKQTAFGLYPAHPQPDPESKDYILQNEVVDADEEFNTQIRRTRTVTIVGKTLVFQRGHANNLLESYDDRTDIKRFTAYAEKVIIRSPLRLPQTDVTLHAVEVVFEDSSGDSAAIITTPRSIPTRAASAIGGNPGQNGADGLSAGNITINAERVIAPPGTKRFVLKGGDGQPAGLGQDGVAGTDLPVVSVYTDGCRTMYLPANTTAYWFKQTHCTGCPRDERRGDWNNWPGDGQPGIAGGKPGNPGKGGDILASFPLDQSLVHAPSGTVGEKAPVSAGGRAGLPNPAYRYYYGCEDQMVPMGEHASNRGSDTPSPDPDQRTGEPGAIGRTGDAFSWITPYSLQVICAHAKDAYLYGHFAAAQSVFSDYDAIITRYNASPEWQALSPEWQAELTALQSEMQSLLHRLANNLDYFGNPAGWVPMLSFEANFTLFQNEIEPAIRTLYLSYWINNAATNLQKKLDGLAAARSKLTQEVEDFRDEFSDVQDLMPGLEVEFLAISNNTERIQQYLDQLEQALMARAEHNVEDRYKVPGWKKGLKTASAIMSVVVHT